MLLVLKGCRRCRGDLFVERLAGEAADLVCLQCGQRRPLRSSMEPVRLTASTWATA